MQIPNESLEDFMKPAKAKNPAEPPSIKRLRPSGVVMVLKPLARSEETVSREVSTGNWSVPLVPAPGEYGLSWFHRTLAVGGAFALIAFLLGIGIHISIYGPPDRSAGNLSSLGVDQQPEAFPSSPKGHDAFDRQAETSSPPIPDELRSVRPAVGRRTATIRAVTSAYVRPRRLRRPKLVLTDFVPTTLIIYSENGQIKTRIEPQLTTGYEISRSFPTS